MICEVRQPSILQVLKNAKMDFVIIDNEHGPFGIEVSYFSVTRLIVLIFFFFFFLPDNCRHVSNGGCLANYANCSGMFRIKNWLRANRGSNWVIRPTNVRFLACLMQERR